MRPSIPLDSRQAQLARALLSRDGPASLAELGSELRLTNRVVRYNLDAVGSFCQREGLRLLRRRGVGVWIEGEAALRAGAIGRLGIENGPAVLDVADRLWRVLLVLLEAAPEAVTSERLEHQLAVSRPTVRRDVRAAEGWLEQHRLHLRRLPGTGIAVRGSEVEVRAALLALVLEGVPASVIIGLAKGGVGATAGYEAAALTSYLRDLDLPLFRTVLAREIRDYDDGDPTMLTSTVGIAILARRVAGGRPARLVRGRLRSLLDHPVSDTARRIAGAFEERLGMALGSAEVAAMTELLLGFVELVDPASRADERLIDIVDRIVRVSAARLHPSLADDDLLRANLTEHFRRLTVRLRYGLPMTNPLRDEVRKRYPDVYRVADDVLAKIGRLGGAPIPDEEIGFLTMYLAGSLERHSLRPKVKVTVVCPAGMATAWILVSRLMSEFPQLEIGRVVSKVAFEQEPSGESAAELIVSTIALDAPDRPSVVVSPLLSERDVRRLSRLLGQAAQH